jgi:hypothetical protein
MSMLDFSDTPNCDKETPYESMKFVLGTGFISGEFEVIS